MKVTKIKRGKFWREKKFFHHRHLVDWMDELELPLWFCNYPRNLVAFFLCVYVDSSGFARRFNPNLWLLLRLLSRDFALDFPHWIWVTQKNFSILIFHSLWLHRKLLYRLDFKWIQWFSRSDTWRDRWTLSRNYFTALFRNFLHNLNMKIFTKHFFCVDSFQLLANHWTFFVQVSESSVACEKFPASPTSEKLYLNFEKLLEVNQFYCSLLIDLKKIRKDTWIRLYVAIAMFAGFPVVILGLK